MDSLNPLIISLEEAADYSAMIIGGKASNLAKLIRAGHRVPRGFCVTVHAYSDFLQTNRLDEKIRFELGRKSFDSMRWEEIWDAALRIRSDFLNSRIAEYTRHEIMSALDKLGQNTKLAVRSSAPKEDTAKASFAGLHESIVGVEGPEALLDSIRIVWASLWSDAALLYQQELNLDPLNSCMAVVVQELIEEEVSGVAFGCDPRDPGSDRSIIEAVPGLCRDLVDGSIDPDRWVLKRSSGEIIEKKTVNREGRVSPILQAAELKQIHLALQSLEILFKWAPDMEWTGKETRFTILQSRPVTTAGIEDDEKAYYLSLRPGESRLKKLADQVAGKLIPELEGEGVRLSNEDPRILNDSQLGQAIIIRLEILNKWKKIYREYFIPFAHGVRYLARYYNDAVNPLDPYEFTGLLKGQDMLSTARNRKLSRLAEDIAKDKDLEQKIRTLVSAGSAEDGSRRRISRLVPDNQLEKMFWKDFNSLLENYMDISYGKERLSDRPLTILQNLLEMSGNLKFKDGENSKLSSLPELEERLFKAVGENRREEALDVLRIGRLSWRLRDDDNLLLGKIESQLIRAVKEGIRRLLESGRLSTEIDRAVEYAQKIADALLDPRPGKTVVILAEIPDQKESGNRESEKFKPRQLTGQPASPGVISGKVRIISGPGDLDKFRAGEILVCDAIQPNMTHLVPLAGAIVERRGGMLIHGAIIAREMGIPCVNGIPDAASRLENGELITVDGFLGIVTVGEPEFDLELNQMADHKNSNTKTAE